MSTTGAPADTEYAALCKRLNELQKEAGAFLARSLRADATDAAVSLRIAKDFATEAIELDDAMKAWRLANGWAK